MKLRLVIFLTVMIYFSYVPNLFGLESNYHIIDSMATVFCRNTTDRINMKRPKTIAVKFPDNEFRSLFESKVLNNLNEIEITTEPSAGLNSMEIVVEDIKVSYLNHETENDTLNREITFNVYSVYYEKFKKEILSSVNYKFSDKISRNDIQFIENSPHNYTKSPVPERKKSFFEEILQPAIFVSSTIITIIILFTARSN